ncbi:MAG TPA: hypothetical protein VN708_13775 [Terriglobales bacterium]|jgi:hypothetical protein|nr:hypothetical protein [Terriglobales bacterium]
MVRAWELPVNENPGSARGKASTFFLCRCALENSGANSRARFGGELTSAREWLVISGAGAGIENERAAPQPTAIDQYSSVVYELPEAYVPP